ncbi:MAG: 2-dehydro-3-deoxy-D-gluconate 5-dehydrogenase [Pseudomonadales bacterium]|nr:2-dehydro-3-deoxy-D-gluconate 5-dehydrogenase [Pseudomonadales bacterium]
MTHPKELFDLGGRVALVTGASRGLGRAIALGLAAAGADVIVTARTREACADVAHQIEALGRRALALGCDVGDWQQVDALVDAAYAGFGRCDVLVNNAGMTQQMMPLTQTTEQMFDRIYSVNTKGPMHLSSLVAARMAGSGGGSIVNIATMGALRSPGHLAMYTSSKAAMVALTRSMADEWASLGIRVNALAPGPFLTDMLDDLASQMQGFLEYSEGVTMLKRSARPEEIVGPVLFLASSASSFVTGQTLAVCGGAI